jgi:hypothetical protein
VSDAPWEVVGLAVVLGVNRFAIPRVALRPRLFWPIQSVTAGLAVGVAVAGMPGLRDFPVVNWLVAGLLAFHVAQNQSIRSLALHRATRGDATRDAVRQLRAVDGGRRDAAVPGDSSAETERNDQDAARRD